MDATSEGPMVGYNVISHPSQILVKYVEIKEDGSLTKGRGGEIPPGCKVSTKHAPLGQYLDEAFHGGTRQYIVPANCELGEGTPITAKDFPVEGGVDRTAKTLRYVNEPAILTFDHDFNPRSTTTLTGPEDLHKIFCELLPGVFDGAAFGGYYSSGSYIYDEAGNEKTGKRGFHLTYAVSDATLIPGATDIIFKRLWSKGYGYIAISRDGKALVRTPFDKKVVEPQQPLFAGGAHCVNAEQRRPEPVWHNGGYLDLSKIPPLSVAEEKEYIGMVEAAKAVAKPDCEEARNAYFKKSVDELVVKEKVTHAQAKKIVESRMEGGLVGSDLLVFDEIGPVTVAEVLSDPAKYDEKTLADPINGDVRGKAILYANLKTGKPLVFSHARGGSKFYLKFDLASLSAKLELMSKDQALDCWLDGLADAALREDERERYLGAVKSKTGLGIAALRKTAREALKNATSGDSADLTEDPGMYLARALVDNSYDKGVRLVALENGLLSHYTGTHWSVTSEAFLEGQLQQRAADEWDHILSMWQVHGKKPSTLSALVTSSLACLRNMQLVPGDPLRLNTPRPSVINCSNGELWLGDTGPELRPHRPESYLTSCSNIAYDPEATSPAFEQALRGMLSFPGGAAMPDQDGMLRHSEELLGYTIQTSRNLKMFVIVVGPGDNGKTKLVQLMELIVGKDAIAFDRLAGVDEKTNRFATGRLVNKQVLVDDDVDHEYLLPDGLMKKIAEKKPLTAEGKFQKAYTFVAQVVPWLLGNSWPRSRDLSRGMKTRANVIYLPRSFLRQAECDESHPDRQRPELWDAIYDNEMSGVLNRLIAGYYRVAKRGSFLPPKSADDAFMMWLSDANVVARFIDEACERISIGKTELTTTTLYYEFNLWCDQNGVQQRHRPQANQFKKRLEDLDVCVKHTNKGSSVLGLRIKKNESGICTPIRRVV